MATIPKYSIAFSDRVGLQEGPKSGPASDTICFQESQTNSIANGATAQYSFSFMVDDRVGDNGKLVTVGCYIYKQQDLGAQDWNSAGVVNLVNFRVDIGTPVGVGATASVAGKGVNISGVVWTNLYNQTTVTNTGDVGTLIDTNDQFAYFEANLITHGAAFVTAANVLNMRSIIRVHATVANNSATNPVNPWVLAFAEALKYKL